MQDIVVIDGSYGEGGGQILRTALSLSAITGRAVRVDNIRAGRPQPGLAAQHVTAARAVAALCGGVLDGDALGSQTLTMIPDGTLHAGDYKFDVAAAREGGSAGAVTLVL
jgi:RNA 3'-terminal phosphate cyclase (ATP)